MSEASKIVETVEQKLERLEQLIVAYAEAFLHHTHTLPNTTPNHDPIITEKPVIRPPAPVPSAPEPIPAVTPEPAVIPSPEAPAEQKPA